MPLTVTVNYQIPREPNNTGIADARTFNAAMDYIDGLLAGGEISSWKPPVNVVGDLPGTDPLGTARVVKGEARIYVWNGSAWIPSNEGATTYVGVWDATNPPAGGNPTLSDATGTKGFYYVVTGSGIQDLGSGPIDFNPGDWVVHNGLIWQKADHTDVVTSVFGRQGAVLAQSGDYTHAQIGSIGVDDHHARDHRATHISGGADAFLTTDLLEAVVRRLRETGGPTDLLMGDVPDGYLLGRSGTDVLGINPTTIVGSNPPQAHAASHEGGSDPITAAGIGAEPAFTKNTAFNKDFGTALGDVCQGNDVRLSDARTPTAHASSHEDGGSDEISVLGLSGLLADPQTPLGHRATHISGGGDAFLATDIIEAIVKRIQETGGPTTLAFGAIADGAVLKRSGTAIIGDVGGSFRCWSATFGSATAAGFSSSSATPVIMRLKTFPGTSIFGTPIRACIIAESSSGNAGYVDIYRPSDGTVIATIGPITAVTPTVYQFVVPWTNPWPTTEEILHMRIYRGPAAATITAYDLTAGLY